MTERRLVLSVEDNDANYALVQRLLESTGLWRVQRARNVDEALQRLGETRFVVVLVDIDLPGPSGLELARTMKSSDEWRSIPLVIVTASVMKHEEDEALAIGCEYFVAKPFDIDRLRAIVLEAAERT
ncbi:response regulator [Nannocystaceae bacterium ST9]